VKAIVFDFDGLILDTETNEFLAAKHMFEQYGAELKFDVWKEWIGTDASPFDVYDHLQQCAGGRLIDREQARDIRKRKFAELMAVEQIRPGVESYLQRARELGLAVGLASSSGRAWIEKYIQPLGIASYFHCMKTADDVAKVKPDPQLYMDAAAALGVSPQEAVAFEDSPNGALAAARAGMRVVIVPNGLTEGLPFGPYDLRIGSMAELSLDQVLERLEGTD
jgi:HAD superfamily hydrolase (TIGR01509 family)